MRKDRINYGRKPNMIYCIFTKDRETWDDYQTEWNVSCAFDDFGKAFKYIQTNF